MQEISVILRNTYATKYEIMHLNMEMFKLENFGALEMCRGGVGLGSGINELLGFSSALEVRNYNGSYEIV